MSTTEVTDVVVLIPGFLGFDKLGKHSYFADAVGKALVDALVRAGRARGSLAVEAVSTSPADSLQQRQGELLAALQKIVTARGRQVRLHLVGHSTGGLDAELLTLRQDLGKEAWSDEHDVVRMAIRSIHTIASPLAGTTLANSPLASLFGIGSLEEARQALESKIVFKAVAPVLRLIQSLASLRNDRAVLDILHGIFDGTPRLGRFVLSAALRRALISNLRPSYVTELFTAGQDPKLVAVHRARFLTIAPKSKKKSQAGRLFDLFYTSTEHAADRSDVPSFVPSLQQRARDGKIAAVAGDPLLLDELVGAVDPASNDAIVNTLRQVRGETDPAQAALELDRVIAIVLADHLDVVGYFPDSQAFEHARGLCRRGSRRSQNGFLESGARFREAQLNDLYAHVALEIQTSISSEAARERATIQA
jgi:pimeloyl-ACP methyl ester carboxylesterase